jgi:NTE family protein
VALVIGSGSVKCAAAIGVWKVLAREGIAVDIAVGCSGGSIYAAAIALGFDVAESERRTLVMWRDLFTRFHYRSLLRAVFPRLLRFDERVG